MTTINILVEVEDSMQEEDLNIHKAITIKDNQI